MPLSSQADNASVGDTAPVFNATTITGDVVRLAEFRGEKPVYLKFWATWCSYCKAEMPHLKTIREQYGDAVEVMTVNVGMNDSVANINAFFQQQGYRLPTIFDAKGDLTSQYGVIGTPQHILIDERGEVVYRTFLANDELDSQLAQWARDAAMFSEQSKPRSLTHHRR
ncbi:MAG: TlpA family protein disulfide reductase [Oceanobacter sp.]